MSVSAVGPRIWRSSETVSRPVALQIGIAITVREAMRSVKTSSPSFGAIRWPVRVNINPSAARRGTRSHASSIFR